MKASVRHNNGRASRLQGAGSKHDASQLFLVRVWPDQGREDGNGRPEWHGKIQHVMSGEASDFSGWPMLVSHLRAMLPPLREAQFKEVTSDQ